MKKFTKIASFLLALAVLIPSLYGCSKEEEKTDLPEGKQGETNVDGEGEVEQLAVLTGVYRGTALPLEENERLNANVKPYLDTVSGEICFLTTKTEEKEVTDENGEIQYTYETHSNLVTVDGDMNVIDKKKLDFGERGNVNKGILTKEYLYYLTDEYGESGGSPTVFLNSMNLSTGEIKTSGSLSDMFAVQDGRWFHVDHIAADNDGNIFFGYDREVAVVNGDFVKQYGVTLKSMLSGMSSSPDGRIFVIQSTDGGEGLFEIDKTAKKLMDEPVYSSSSGIDNVMFGEGYDFYYSNNTGLYGQSGDGEGELLMNYMNSDVNPDDFTPLAVIDKDNILAREIINTPDVYTSTAAIYKKSADVDLSSITVYELAAPEGVDYELRPVIVAYNKEHRDRRINVTDYSQYADKGNRTAGVTMMGNDIASGMYKPDIIILNSYTGDSILDYMTSNDLFADYNTLLADKPEILDDMFGGAKRALSTSDGRMWGMAREFRVSTFLTNDPALKDKTSWTMGEMLDYNDTLPEGTVLIDDIYRDAFFRPEAAFFYNSFVDMENYTADFENETFYKLLDFIAGLPTEAEYLSQSEADYDSDNRYEPYRSGKVALYVTDFRSVTDWMRNQLVWDTTEFNPIGYPTETGYGSMAQADTSYMITKWCDDPDGAWEFIERLVMADPNEYTRAGMRIRYIPVFKSMYNTMCEEYSDDSYIFRFYYDGSSGWGNGRGTLEEVQASLERPGIAMYFDNDAAEKYAEFLENRVGGGMASSIPEEVMGIIGEEVSAYAAGVNDAEGCAGKIQSRVAIWLAEHE